MPAAAREFARHALKEEMPRGLKKYLETVVLPEYQLRSCKNGFSLSTMCRLLLQEGFKYTEHKKAIYYDGHERPDVVEDRQTRFIPGLLSLKSRLVQYAVEDTNKESQESPPDNYVERRLVLCAHDEATMQANDSVASSWVLDGEQPLKKKGVGRGIHRSDVICSTVGWLSAAGQSLEYGKNYEGYWNGELFVQQLRTKIIPAFEEAHGPGFQALFFIDNSQGHAAYTQDALLASRMNLRPGGKQAHLKNGWYFSSDRTTKIRQEMSFPPDHPQFLNQPKGMKQVLLKRGLWRARLTMKCEGGCEHDDCCVKRILELQPDFQEQKSLVQEVIEAAGHLCIFLPKFHCEINFIEYFWGAVKKYLRDHCDYTFGTLKENIPKAMESISVQLIRKWEHRAWRFVHAYSEGLGAKDSQAKVKQFSSKIYKSHRRAPIALAKQMEQEELARRTAVSQART